MKFKLQYDAGKWLCSCDELFDLLKNEASPDGPIVEALEAFQRRYYPDERADSPDYPWIAHGTPPGVTVLRTSIVTHDLTWHWRLLLPCLRDYDSGSSDSIVLCVSQIRQWQLVSCFRMEWPKVAAKELPAELRSARKALLRSPVFGKSHRIARSEVYASFYEKGVREQIKQAVEDAKNEFRLAHILGRYDAYFKVENVKLASGQYEFETQQVVDLDPELAPAELGKDLDKPASKTVWASTDDVCRPYGMACLPQFADLDAEQKKPKELLFSSDNYCRAFEQVSDVLNDPSAKAILIIAPPGSGKEDLSEIFHVCRRQQGQLVRIILAGLDEKAAAFQLFNVSSADIDHRLKRVKDRLEPICPFPCQRKDGAVFKALGGTLVIDELDKADDKIRSMLLRFLESDEVTVPGTSIVLKIPASMRPLYVFAGSKTRKEFFQLAPIDFWSRITHIVEMQHPLELGEAEERFRTAEDYLRLFWFKQVESYFKSERLIEPPDDPTQRDLFEPLRANFTGWWKFFCSCTVGEFVAWEIAGALCAPGQPVPSIRTLRGTVARCFNSLFHALLYHKRTGAPLEKWAEAHRKIIAGGKPTGEPIDRLKELMAMLHGDCKAGSTLSVEEEAAIAEIRALIRASASIQV